MALREQLLETIVVQTWSLNLARIIVNWIFSVLFSDFKKKTKKHSFRDKSYIDGVFQSKRRDKYPFIRVNSRTVTRRFITLKYVNAGKEELIASYVASITFTCM